MRGFVWACVWAALLGGCASQQAMFLPIDGAVYPARAADFEVQLFRNALPERAYKEIARLNVHLEKTSLLGSSFEVALAQLEEQTRACGGEAIIKVVEERTLLNETRIYNVSAVAIVFVD